MADKTGSEGSEYSAEEVFSRNKPYLAEGEHSYNTDLGKAEPEFRDWVSKNKVEFDPDAKVSDYDMRGFYKALQDKDPKAMSAVNPNDNKMHYPDFWKTPYDMTFSAESQWANPATAPKWNEQDQLVAPDGNVVYDEKKQASLNLLKQVLQNKEFIKLLHQQLTQVPAQ